MQDDDYGHSSVEIYIDKLGYRSTELQGYHILQEGLSGASVYRIEFPDETALLKITAGSAGSVPLNRAHRELAFYRDLAGEIPLTLPRILAMYEEAEHVVLLMPMYRPSPPPELWTSDDFLKAADQLGAFHAAFWGQTEALSAFSWLDWSQREDRTVDVAQAYSDWQTLREQLRFAAVFTEQDQAWLRHLLNRIQDVSMLFQALPLTVCHGDCITSNILRDGDGHFVWADWQEVRFARGPEDLAFFLQRASIVGAAVQREVVIDTYHHSLENYTGQTISVSAIHQIMDAAELWVRVLYWPAYLVQAAESTLADMLHDIRALAEKLGVAD